MAINLIEPWFGLQNAHLYIAGVFRCLLVFMAWGAQVYLRSMILYFNKTGAVNPDCYWPNKVNTNICSDWQRLCS